MISQKLPSMTKWILSYFIHNHLQKENSIHIHLSKCCNVSIIVLLGLLENLTLPSCALQNSWIESNSFLVMCSERSAPR